MCFFSRCNLCILLQAFSSNKTLTSLPHTAHSIYVLASLPFLVPEPFTYEASSDTPENKSVPKICQKQKLEQLRHWFLIHYGNFYLNFTIFIWYIVCGLSELCSITFTSSYMKNSTSDLPFVISVQRDSYGLFHEPAWLYIFTLMRTNSCNFEKENGTLKGPPPLMAPLNPSLPEPPRNDLVSWSSRLTIWNWVYNRWTNSLHW